MSDQIRCEVCSKLGNRRFSHHCPEEWFYGEVIDDESPELSPIVVAVCSKECKESFWLKGPGNLRTTPEYLRRYRMSEAAKESSHGSEDRARGGEDNDTTDSISRIDSVPTECDRGAELTLDEGPDTLHGCSIADTIEAEQDSGADTERQVEGLPELDSRKLDR